MQVVIAESNALIAKLVAEAEKMTDKTELNANKRAQKMEASNLKYAKERSTELKALYDQLLDTKKSQDEARAFDDMIAKAQEQAD